MTAFLLFKDKNPTIGKLISNLIANNDELMRRTTGISFIVGREIIDGSKMSTQKRRQRRL